MDPVRLKRAVLMFLAEFVVWLLAFIVIGAIRGDWSSLLHNGSLLLMAVLFSGISAFFDYTKGAGKK